MEDYSFLIPNEDKSLILSDSFMHLVSDIENLVDLDFPVMLRGHAGVGKNKSIEYIACKRNQPLMAVDCSGDMTSSSLLGRISVDSNGNIVWEDGMLTKAVEKGVWFVGNEINSVDMDVLFALHGLLDGGYMVIPNRSKVVKAHPNFKMFITMNYGSYYGVKPVNQAFLDRFVTLDVINDEEIDKKILSEMAYSEDVKTSVMNLVNKIRTPDQNRMFNISQYFGHRTFNNMKRLSTKFDVVDAFNMAYTYKLPDKERKYVSDLVNDFLVDNTKLNTSKIGRSI